ncbi:NnrS family protein [Oceanicella actignis]|uniref:NnrS family protein n=1 Tax=Oceanicella actignis TaxID=1189325 RepID=UPI0011E83B65|nr:NnrS family protein [Oceanicella actignis]TYO89244.1 uncharacterized protein involved in response to NO [Oceanicella actignis]
MSGSAARMRAWKGPAVLSYGFRPFFLSAGIWAALAMALWAAMLTGREPLPIGLDPVSWHAHEMMFGYLGAVMAGFLLTAVPNWTGRLPVTGWPLAALAGLWLAGRAAMALGAPAALAAAADLSLGAALLVFLAREILAGRNWRNLPVLALLGLWAAGNALFHLEAARGGFPAQGPGLRLGLVAAVMLIALIGGRIVPSFTRNWLVRRGESRLPAPMGRGDAVALSLAALALGAWTAAPDARATAAALAAAGAAHLWRMSRWRGARCRAEALVWVLHAAYAFVPLGFAAMAAGIAAPQAMAAAQHLWMAGAVGLMTLAVMTRASLGHGGRPLHAGRPVAALYWAVIVAVAARLAGGLAPEQAWLLHLAAGAWIAAFAGFAIIFWPILTRPRPDAAAA